MGKNKKSSRKNDRRKARDHGDDLVQCPHLHFKTDVVDRNVLSREQHLNLLSTPKGYRWEEYKDKKEAGDGEGPDEDHNPPAATRRVVCSGRRMKKSEKIYVHNFLAEIWTLLTPEMVDRLKGMLMNEFGMSPQEANLFVMEQRELNITNSSTVSLYKKARTLPDGSRVDDAVIKMRHPNKTYCDQYPKAAIGIRNSWIKEYANLLSGKISTYVLETMCADRSDRQQMIANVLLDRFNSALEQKASMTDPKTRTHKTMVLVADRLSLWLDKNVKMSKETAERLKSLEKTKELNERRGHGKKSERQHKKEVDGKRGKDDSSVHDEGKEGAKDVNTDMEYQSKGEEIERTDQTSFVAGKGEGAMNDEEEVNVEGTEELDKKGAELGRAEDVTEYQEKVANVELEDADKQQEKVRKSQEASEEQVKVAEGIPEAQLDSLQSENGALKDEELKIPDEAGRAQTTVNIPPSEDAALTEREEENVPEENGRAQEAPVDTPLGKDVALAETEKEDLPEETSRTQETPVDSPVGKDVETLAETEKENLPEETSRTRETPVDSPEGKDVALAETEEENVPEGTGRAQEIPVDTQQGQDAVLTEKEEDNVPEETGRAQETPIDTPLVEDDDQTVKEEFKILQENGQVQEASIDNPQDEDAAPTQGEEVKVAEDTGGAQEAPVDAQLIETNALDKIDESNQEKVVTDTENKQPSATDFKSEDEEVLTNEEKPLEEVEIRLNEEESITDKDGIAKSEYEGGALQEGERRSATNIEAKRGDEVEKKEEAVKQSLSLEQQTKMEEVIKSVASIIAESPSAPSSRQTALKNILEKELEKEFTDEDQEVINEVASKVGTWIDSSVKKVEMEYGDRGKARVRSISSWSSQTVVGERLLAPDVERPIGRIFKVRKMGRDFSDYDVTLISHTKAKHKIAEARGKIGFDFQVPDPEAALEPKDLKSWADWATRVSDMATNWADWIEGTVKEAQTKGKDYKKKESTKELPIDWEEFKESKSKGAHRYAQNKKQVSEQAELWIQKSQRAMKGNQTR